MSDALDSDVPVYPEAFFAWRGWTVDNEGYLHSINGSEIWTPGEEFSAVCTVGRNHNAPAPRCSCGIYTTKSLKKLRANGYHNSGAFGIVSVWGEIIDGGAGYRSQFAYPKMIFVPHLSWKLAEGLEQYGVDVKLLNPFTGEFDIDRIT